ncbi:heterokaryon incompatibility protein-domain-containing protein [Xylariaceae sp. FL1272]|nr:heterokaryon incompatibility protein-domain-containing protein [Xylariaceae sp. FL1272]
MRLLNTETLCLETYVGRDTPPYAILSHTWESNEILFHDIHFQGEYPRWKGMPGAAKVLKSAAMAAANGFSHIWIDSCCIDKNSSSELSEAINSMFTWYENSAACYAYLSDIASTSDLIHDGRAFDSRYKSNRHQALEDSRWFTRGWTLQELIAPREVCFFDSYWQFLGTRTSLAKRISAKTLIDIGVLLPRLTSLVSLFDQERCRLDECSVHTKMGWARNRITTRPEDRAYSLMGLFDVNMPLLYGEGSVKAFRRLQDEIIKRTNDQSILLHRPSNWTEANSVFAESPDDFKPEDRFLSSHRQEHFLMQTTKHGLQVDVLLCPAPYTLLGPRLDTEARVPYLCILESAFGDDPLVLHRPAILVEELEKDHVYYRISKEIFRIQHDDHGRAVLTSPAGDRNRHIEEVFDSSKTKRRRIRLTEKFEKRMQYSSLGSKIFLQPISKHLNAPSYRYGACLPAMTNGAIKGTLSVHNTKSSLKLILVAFIRMHLGNSGDDSIGIFIFSYDNKFELGASNKGSGQIFAHIVEDRRWMKTRDFDESKTKTNTSFLKIDDIDKELWRLPLNLTSHGVFDHEVSSWEQWEKEWRRNHVLYNILQTRELHRNDSASIATTDGNKITARISEEMFLEEPVHHLHVHVGRNRSPRGMDAVRKVATYFHPRTRKRK